MNNHFLMHRLVIAGLTLSCIAACSTPAETNKAANSEPKKVAVAEPAASSPTPVTQGNLADQSHGADQINNTPFRLMGMAKQQVKLNDEMTSKIKEFLSASSSQGHLIITGYCDKDSQEQAKDIAISRAVAVKKIAIEHGVTANKIRIHYITNTKNQGVELDWK